MNPSGYFLFLVSNGFSFILARNDSRCMLLWPIQVNSTSSVPVLVSCLKQKNRKGLPFRFILWVILQLQEAFAFSF